MVVDALSLAQRGDARRRAFSNITTSCRSRWVARHRSAILRCAAARTTPTKRGNTSNQQIRCSRSMRWNYELSLGSFRNEPRYVVAVVLHEERQQAQRRVSSARFSHLVGVMLRASVAFAGSPSANQNTRMPVEQAAGATVGPVVERDGP